MIIKREEDLKAAVAEFLKFAQGRKKVMLIGEMGVGKTSFVKAFAKALKVEEKVQSPTFALVNEYNIQPPDGKLEKMYHLDLYRLKTIEEALDIGIEDYLENEAYCLIEWPELIEPIWPPDSVQIKFELLEDSSRKIIFL